MAEFYVKVETGCSEFCIKPDNITKVKLTEPAENGRANAELVIELGNILSQKPAIISGHQSRRKKLKADMPRKKVKKKFERF